jgi:hypothetical protein
MRKDLDRLPGADRTPAIDRIPGIRDRPERVEADPHPAVEGVVSGVGGAGVDVNAKLLQLTFDRPRATLTSPCRRRVDGDDVGPYLVYQPPQGRQADILRREDQPPFLVQHDRVEPVRE